MQNSTHCQTFFYFGWDSSECRTGISTKCRVCFCTQPWTSAFTSLHVLAVFSSHQLIPSKLSAAELLCCSASRRDTAVDRTSDVSLFSTIGCHTQSAGTGMLTFITLTDCWVTPSTSDSLKCNSFQQPLTTSLQIPLPCRNLEFKIYKQNTKTVFLFSQIVSQDTLSVIIHYFHWFNLHLKKVPFKLKIQQQMNVIPDNKPYVFKKYPP